MQHKAAVLPNFKVNPAANIHSFTERKHHQQLLAETLVDLGTTRHFGAIFFNLKKS